MRHAIFRRQGDHSAPSGGGFTEPPRRVRLHRCLVVSLGCGDSALMVQAASYRRRRLFGETSAFLAIHRAVFNL
jgi:hypothetical protein